MRNRAGYGREKGAKAFGPPQIRRAMQRALVMAAISRRPVSLASARLIAAASAAAARLDAQPNRAPAEFHGEPAGRHCPDSGLGPNLAGSLRP